MATHSSILARRIPWIEESGGLWSHFSSVQSLSRVQLFVTHGLQYARLPCPSPTPGAYSNLFQWSWWCHPTISSTVLPFHSCLQSSQHQSLCQRVSSSHQVAKVLEFQLHQSFQWIFRLISFRMDWLDLLAVQGTLKSFLQHHGSKASILRCSAFL